MPHLTMTAAESSSPPPSLSTTTTTSTPTPTTATIATNNSNNVVFSNLSVSISKQDFDVYPNFVSNDETLHLLRDVGLMNAVKTGDISVIGKDFVWEGFEQRRRVRRFHLTPRVVNNHNDNNNTDNNTDDNSALPPSLLDLWRRIQEQQQQHDEPTETRSPSDSLQQETEIAIEVYPENQLIHLGRSSRTQVMTFDTSSSPVNSSSSDYTGHERNFVAILPLNVSLIENSNRPERRDTQAWHLMRPKEVHSTSALLPKQTLLVKRHGEYLYEWRSRIASIATSETTADWSRQRSEKEIAIIKECLSDNSTNKSAGLVVLIKIYHLPKDLMPSFSSSSSAAAASTGSNSINGVSNGTNVESPEFGYVRTAEHEQLDLQRQAMSSDEVPPLEELLTIIVTTSPIRSHPSTELLERVFETFTMCGPEFAFKCRKLIICDGCRQRDESTSKRHTNDKQSMRNGIVNNEQYINYVEFKAKLRRLCEEALPETPFYGTDVEEIDERQGYGFALRHGLRHCNITTPYVIVIQHDRTFMRPTPIKEVIRTMWNHSNIKYVGMSMRSNLMYRDIFISQYGKSYMDEMAACTLRPTELALDAEMFGPDSESTRQMDYGKGDNGNNPQLRQSIIALADSYRGSQQYADHLAWLKANGQDVDRPSRKTNQLSLTPTFFWYDNVHICDTAHYRDFVYNPQYKMVVRGGFVEDKLSPAIKKTVERLGLSDGHARFGCYLLDDHSGMFFTGHLDGGSYLTKEGQEVWRAKKIEEGKIALGKQKQATVRDD